VTERPRAVFDTNIFVSAFLSRNPSSPTQELIRRWLDGELTLLVSEALVDEVTEKLLERRIGEERVTELLSLLIRLAEWVEVPEGSIQAAVRDDPDDDPILACAVIGQAGFLVTYDSHFDSLGGAFQGIRIMKALPFLWALRGDAEARKQD
jgi:uncharacterized protein